ncbi:Transposable element, IS605 OrfB family [Halanaeroarchaeum sp. HSR-CO]|nr:Transposable element, IS605 OrfB family [Halanaeroarchaeum sp. HSR-CO]
MAEEYVRRTAITRLTVDDEQRDLLEDTISEWKRGCQIATDMAWRQVNSKRDVQPLAYDAVRDRTELGSQHAILAAAALLEEYDRTLFGALHAGLVTTRDECFVSSERA